MYLLFLAVELISALQSGRSVWWQVQDSLDMLSLLLLSFGGIPAVLELIGPTAWLLSHRVADWLKMRSAMRRYLQEWPAIPRSRRSCNVQYSNTTIILSRADDAGFAMWLAKDRLPLW